MKAIIYISGVVGEEITLTDIIRQFKSFEAPTSVLVKINSEGGSVEQGEAIFDYFEGLKSTIQVDTEAVKALSISAKIFSVGQKRIVEDSDKVIMIHNPWTEVKGGAEKFKLVAEVLEEIEKDFSSFYSVFLDIPEATAKSLLQEEKFFSGVEAVEMGFATELKSAVKAVAKYEVKESVSFSNNLKPKRMNKIAQLKKAMLAFLESDIKALVLLDSTGMEIEFPDLEVEGKPKKGDVGKIDGEAVKDGEYVIPSLEDKIVVFKDGVVEEVKEAVEVEETEEEVQARLDARAEEVQQISVWTQEASNTSFEVGEVMTYEYDGESYPYGAGEYYIPSIDKNVVTDASGKIVVHKDKVVAEKIEEEEEGEVEAILAKVELKVSAKFEEKLRAQEKKIQTLNKLVGSKEFKAQEQQPKENTKKASSGNYLSNVLRNKKNNK